MKIYCRHPFNTTSQVIVTQPCGPGHEGAKDLNFFGMPYGTPVYAMESGSVAEIRRGLPSSPTSAGLPNNVVVKGMDQFYTEYAHITPVQTAPNHFPPESVVMFWANFNRPLKIGSRIRKGDLLGWVDKSGYTTGSPTIHIGRYDPGDLPTLHSRPSSCNWYIHGVDAPIIMPECDPGAYSTFTGRWPHNRWC